MPKTVIKYKCMACYVEAHRTMSENTLNRYFGGFPTNGIVGWTINKSEIAEESIWNTVPDKNSCCKYYGDACINIHAWL